MPYDVEYPRRVDKQLDNLRDDGGALLRADFEEFAADMQANPSIDIQKMKGTKDEYRLRVGDFRLIFRRDKADKVLVALKADDRKDVY